MNYLSSLLNPMPAYLCLESQLLNVTTIRSFHHSVQGLSGGIQSRKEAEDGTKLTPLCCQIKKTLVCTSVCAVQCCVDV